MLLELLKLLLLLLLLLLRPLGTNKYEYRMPSMQRRSDSTRRPGVGPVTGVWGPPKALRRPALVLVGVDEPGDDHDESDEEDQA